MAKQQKTFTREFKLEAVQLVKSSGKPMSHIARDLGISDSALYHWCKQLSDQGEQAFPGSGHQTAEQEEIRRLKRELEVTRQERDILKKESASTHGKHDEGPVHCCPSAAVPDQQHVSRAGGGGEWLLCLAAACAQPPQPGESRLCMGVRAFMPSCELKERDADASGSPGSCASRD
jgi:transposase